MEFKVPDYDRDRETWIKNIVYELLETSQTPYSTRRKTLVKKLDRLTGSRAEAYKTARRLAKEWGLMWSIE